MSNPGAELANAVANSADGAISVRTVRQNPDTLRCNVDRP